MVLTYKKDNSFLVGTLDICDLVLQLIQYVIIIPASFPFWLKQTPPFLTFPYCSSFWRVELFHPYNVRY